MSTTVQNPVFPIKAPSEFDRIYVALKQYILFEELQETMGNSDDVDDTVKALQAIRLPMQEKCVRAMAYYVMKGYNSDTFAECCKFLKISKQMNKQVVCSLTKRGWLEKSVWNHAHRTINQDLLTYCKCIQTGTSPKITLKFED